MYGEWSVKHAYTQTFLAHCAFQVNCWNKVKDLDRSLDLVNVLNIFLVLYVTQTLSKGTISVGNLQTSTVQVYREVPLPFLASHVIRFPCVREKIIEMYNYTKSTRSQSLTVVQHTVSDLQASKRFFRTYNTVVLYSRLIWACLPMVLQAN